MPELPDIAVYLAKLDERISGRVLEHVRVVSPFLIRTVDPPIEAAQGQGVRGLRRLGKRVVWCMDDDLFLVFHLMVAGRFRWAKPGAKLPGKIGLAAFDFETGSVLLTEAGSKKRASLHLVKGEAALAKHDPGGLEVLEADLPAFATALTGENHTLKRALTDPRLLAGIGNAYSDEILHAAGLSPVKLTSRLTDEEIAKLFEAACRTLNNWTDRLLEQFAGKFPGPGDVTAFRDDFAVHGQFGKPCPVCGCKVQRIRYADNETNYCAQCQTGGRILADRSLSRLLR
ncbi:MAG: Fpg/Nei family DNA glycosylase [Phycisphaerae bacterium]